LIVQGAHWVPYLHEEFDTREEAIDLIHEYARQTGFVIRDRGGDVKRAEDGTAIVQCKFFFFQSIQVEIKLPTTSYYLFISLYSAPSLQS